MFSEPATSLRQRGSDSSVRNEELETLECRLLLSRSSHGHHHTARTPPASPSEVTASPLTPAVITVGFQDNSTTETGFVLERSVNGGKFNRLFTLPAWAGTGPRSVADTNAIEIGTTYTYRVKALGGGKLASAYAGPITLKMVWPPPDPPPTPAPPPSPPPVTPPPPTQKGPSRNLLFFGNSFTYTNNVPDLVASLATADGYAAPKVFTQTPSGWTLKQHAAKVAADGPKSIIDGSLPTGEQWDDVVLQEYSTRATTHPDAPTFGDVAEFRQNLQTLVGDVRANSPAVHAVVMETWARGAQASAYYPGAYTGPAEMQDDLLDSDKLGLQDLAASFGAGAGDIAGVGEGWRAMNWDRSLYNGSDEYHPSARGSLLAAMIVYDTIYHENVADIAPASLKAALSSRGLSAADFTQLAAVADGQTVVVSPAPPIVQPAAITV
jgi:hypothetical protein